MKPRVAILYLCYGMEKYLDDVVDAIQQSDYPKEALTTYFIPNGSPDNIVEKIKKDVLPRSKKEFSECILLNDGENRGFAGGNNLAIKEALSQEFDYVFLHNGDLKLDVNTISTLVDGMEADKTIGSAQPLVMYWDDHEKVNVSGGMVHIAGYGFARDNLRKLSDVDYSEIEDVFYASGAALMLRSSVLEEIGLMEEGFFMYHEDLELGWRIRISGYRNVLFSKTFVFHDYSFSRNPMKFAWMELYRWIVVLAYYRLPTLILIMPLLILVEAGTWLMALKGGWLKAKWWAYKEVFKKRTWVLLFSMRKRAQKLRVIKDKEILARVTGVIEAQEQHNSIVDIIANPIITVWLKLYQFLIIW